MKLWTSSALRCEELVMRLHEDLEQNSCLRARLWLMSATLLGPLGILWGTTEKIGHGRRIEEATLCL